MANIVSDNIDAQFYFTLRCIVTRTEDTSPAQYLTDLNTAIESHRKAQAAYKLLESMGVFN